MQWFSKITCNIIHNNKQWMTRLYWDYSTTYTWQKYKTVVDLASALWEVPVAVSHLFSFTVYARAWWSAFMHPLTVWLWWHISEKGGAYTNQGITWYYIMTVTSRFTFTTLNCLTPGKRAFTCIMAGRSYLLRNISANLGDVEICSNNESHVSRDHQLRKTLFFDMNVLHIKLG